MEKPTTSYDLRLLNSADLTRFRRHGGRQAPQTTFVEEHAAARSHAARAMFRSFTWFINHQKRPIYQDIQEIPEHPLQKDLRIIW